MAAMLHSHTRVLCDFPLNPIPLHQTRKKLKYCGYMSCCRLAQVAVFSCISQRRRGMMYILPAYQWARRLCGNPAQPDGSNCKLLPCQAASLTTYPPRYQYPDTVLVRPGFLPSTVRSQLDRWNLVSLHIFPVRKRPKIFLITHPRDPKKLGLHSYFLADCPSLEQHVGCLLFHSIRRTYALGRMYFKFVSSYYFVSCYNGVAVLLRLYPTFGNVQVVSPSSTTQSPQLRLTHI